MQLTLVNSNLFVNFTDGSQFFGDVTTEQKQTITELQVMSLTQKISSEDFEVKLKELIFPKIKEIKEKRKEVEDIKKVVPANSDFEWIDNKLYYKPIPLSIPKVLATKFKSLIETNSKELANWIKFWCWVSRIENAKARDTLYTYMEKNDLTPTKEGLVIGFRRANARGDDPKLMKFVTQQYLRLKKAKKATYVEVLFNSATKEYSLKSGVSGVDTGKGILKNLYESGDSSDNYFESQHYNDFTNRPEKFYIGKETRLAPGHCDFNPNNSCSRGLHLSGYDYSASGFGNTPIACVFNPMDVLGCPDSHSTMRVQAQTFICVLDRDKDREFELTPEIEEMIHEIYQSHIVRLENLIKAGTPADENEQVLSVLSEEFTLPTLPSMNNVLAILKQKLS